MKHETNYSKIALPKWQHNHPNARVFRNNTGMAYQGNHERRTNKGFIEWILTKIRPIFFGVGKPVKDKKTGRVVQKGGGDYIGWTSEKLCDILGEEKFSGIPPMPCIQDCKNCRYDGSIAVFTNIEIKTENGKESKDQKEWKQMVLDAGGISEVLKEGE